MADYDDEMKAKKKVFDTSTGVISRSSVLIIARKLYEEISELKINNKDVTLSWVKNNLFGKKKCKIKEEEVVEDGKRIKVIPEEWEETPIYFKPVIKEGETIGHMGQCPNCKNVYWFTPNVFEPKEPSLEEFHKNAKQMFGDPHSPPKRPEIKLIGIGRNYKGIPCEYCTGSSLKGIKNLFATKCRYCKGTGKRMVLK